MATASCIMTREIRAKPSARTASRVWPTLPGSKRRSAINAAMSVMAASRQSLSTIRWHVGSKLVNQIASGSQTLPISRQTKVLPIWPLSLISTRAKSALVHADPLKDTRGSASIDDGCVAQEVKRQGLIHSDQGAQFISID